MYQTIFVKRINLFQENGYKTKKHFRCIWILRILEVCSPQSKTPLGMCVHMHICMYVRKYVCMYVSVYVSVYVYKHALMYNFPAGLASADIHVMFR
jgi:hypothetical protein